MFKRPWSVESHETGLLGGFEMDQIAQEVLFEKRHGSDWNSESSQLGVPPAGFFILTTDAGTQAEKRYYFPSQTADTTKRNSLVPPLRLDVVLRKSVVDALWR